LRTQFSEKEQSFSLKSHAMFEKIRIQNFKSVYDETLELGRVNVFIGENGSGKSNLLEAVAFASAAAGNEKFDNDILFSKGVRIAMSELMFSSFLEKKQNKSVTIELENHELEHILFDLETVDSGFFPNWRAKENKLHDAYNVIDANLKAIEKLETDVSVELNNIDSRLTFIDSAQTMNATLTKLKKGYLESRNKYENMEQQILKMKKRGDEHKFELQQLGYLDLTDFLIYTANTTFLRGIHTESRKEPLGINGEGLDVLLASFDKDEIEKLKRYNYLIGWLEDFFMDMDDALKLRGYKLNRSKSVLYFKDRFMMRKNNVFSAENSNEGILHILFYLALMISKRTPKFFAIDNIESSLNPHLCREIMTIICDLAKEEGAEKQLLITTHNPAILDGLNLNDDDIRLFEVYRNNNGHTKARRIQLNADNKPEQLKLSELWTRGYLGATPKNF
jgi:AAA15 family ATPase/GTPase